MTKVKSFLTMQDLIKSGACKDGVIAWCDRNKFYMGNTSLALNLSNENERQYIEFVAGLSGYGSGSGYGDGSGDGDGYGYGSGYGDGSGSGYGDGSGDGDGYGSGYGYGDGSGDGDGYGYGYG